MFTVASAVRSLAFTKNGSHLIAGNDKGTLVVFDLNAGAPVDIIQTCQQRAIWSIDVCWDDALIAIGTEVGSIELYSLKKILARAEQAQRDQQSLLAMAPLAETQVSNGLQILQRTSHPAFVRCYQTKGSGIQLV